MPICALPEHLRDNGSRPKGDGTDHDNAAQELHKRSWKSFGPRCPAVPWYKLSAWSVLRISIPYTNIGVPVFPVLKRWRRFPVLLIGYNVPRWMAREDAGGARMLWTFADRWIVWIPELFVTDPDTGEKTQVGPSPIQRGARVSFMIVWPLGIMFTMIRPGWKKPLFLRFIGRWDSLDDYHVCPANYVGLGYN